MLRHQPFDLMRQMHARDVGLPDGTRHPRCRLSRTLLDNEDLLLLIAEDITAPMRARAELRTRLLFQRAGLRGRAGPDARRGRRPMTGNLIWIKYSGAAPPVHCARRYCSGTRPPTTRSRPMSMSPPLSPAKQRALLLVAAWLAGAATADRTGARAQPRPAPGGAAGRTGAGRGLSLIHI